MNNTKPLCDGCGEVCAVYHALGGEYDEYCQDCCPHEYTDHYVCDDCGKDVGPPDLDYDPTDYGEGGAR